MISHLYDFSNFKIYFTFFYESFKDLIFSFLLLFDLFFVVDMVTQFFLFFKTEYCTN